MDCKKGRRLKVGVHTLTKGNFYLLLFFPIYVNTKRHCLYVFGGSFFTVNKMANYNKFKYVFWVRKGYVNELCVLNDACDLIQNR